MLIKNKLIIVCVLFTVLTVTSSVFGLFTGARTVDHFHILMRFTITLLALGSLYLFDWLKNLRFYQVHIIHYVLTMSAVFLLVFLSGFFVSLHPDAYRDIFLNYTIVYLGVTLFEVVAFLAHRKLKARQTV